MSDIKSMLSNLTSSNSDNSPNNDAAPKQSKQQTIEKTYQKKTQLEHILLRPDTYIGSIESQTESAWIFDFENKCMVEKEIKYVPGLYKIFDEILVNAADNKQRDSNMDCIKINIDAEANVVSVWNNGDGIPVVMHKDENMYVPTLIFGNLLTSSNYDDDQEKVTGGRNGYGAKLCNIFSTKFTVETGSKQYKSQFKQTWANNMTKASNPKIKHFDGKDFTKITFSPDLEKFGMTKLDDDIVALMSRRAFDIAASTRGVKVELNGKRLPVKNFKDYVGLYLKDKKDSAGNNVKIIYEIVNPRWEVAMAVSDQEYQQVSFVNSIATTQGGKHVDYVVDMLVKHISEALKKKNKVGINIKSPQIKAHMWIFINCLIVNPSFDSQTKVRMTLLPRKFGSTCTLSEKFVSSVLKSGIIEKVLEWVNQKAHIEIAKTSGKKRNKLTGIPKLEDANKAGSPSSLECTLILTEGDSAKTLVISGLSVLGRDYYGVFPLRGKLLNVREATAKQILENAEIKNLILILGLNYKTKYNSEQAMKSLRYGKLMIMTDQDQDGSHIKGLVINFIHHNWPELLRQNFLEEFITPIVKATKAKQVLSFYSLPEFQEWKNNTPNQKAYAIKYYKGLGTSTADEAREYFSDMARHRIQFRYIGQQDDDNIVLAFSKKHIESRKEWLTNFMVDSRRRKEMGLPERYLYTKDTKFVSFTDFINLELVLYSNADNIRSIPCVVDGVKPGQRKVLFTCFKRNDQRQVKVAQLAASVAEKSAYHHGETSLAATIVNLAQNFVGSNNINLLEPIGQFGSRLTGGKDSASARYIFTKLSPLTRLIFHPDDDPLLKHEYDDNLKIEPVWYIPIIPMVLVNGADGIGTGWMTRIPNFNPREIVQNIKNMLDEEEPTPMLPWYKNFVGTIEDYGEQRFIISGEIAVLGGNKVEITELPVGVWTQTYKEHVLEPLLMGSEKQKAIISDYREYHTDTKVKFVVTILPGQMENVEKEGFHKVFRLQTTLSTGSMCAFDEFGCLRRYEMVGEILKEFYTLRLKMYQKRKDFMIGMLEAEAAKLTNQARFIMEKCSGELTVENKKRKTIIEELIRKKYAPDPVVEWKLKNMEDEEPEQLNEEEEETEDSSSKFTDAQKYNYLLGMSMWMLTDEKKNELLRKKDTKLSELESLRRKTPNMLWNTDLDTFCNKLNEVEEQEKSKQAKSLKVKGSEKDTKKSRTKLNMKETLPSPYAQRVVPKVTEDTKRKINNALKLKENKEKKGIKREIITESADDEFDTMLKDKRTLVEKLGTPEEIIKKAKNKKGKDGFKQTKLDFKAKNEDKANGSPKKSRKKKKGSDSEDDVVSGSDIEFRCASPVIQRTVNRRAAAKVIKYAELADEQSSDDSDEMFENDAVKEKPITQSGSLTINSDSEPEILPKHQESSEDLFDSLVGRKSDTSLEKDSPIVIPKRKAENKRVISDSELSFGNSSDTDFGKSKPKAKKKRIESDNYISDDSDSDYGKKKSKPKKKPRNKKKLDSDDDESSDFEIKKTSKSKKK